MTPRGAPRPRVLVVAGRDSSRGAGVDADRDALADLAVDATYVVTADTDQDDAGVRAVGARDPERWLAEASDALPVAAVKFGLLPGVAALRAAARLVERCGGVPIVVDPVVASSSGFEFLDAAARAILLEELLPAGVILTPNVPELAALTACPPAALARDVEARAAAAAELLARGAAAVVVKGGHGGEDPVVDLVLAPAAAPVRLEHPRLAGARLRGTGCRFASALAARLALGDPVPAAARAAAELVLRRLRAARETGR